MLISMRNKEGRASVALLGWRLREPDYPFNRAVATELYYRALINKKIRDGQPFPPEWLAAQWSRIPVGWTDDNGGAI